MVALSSCKTELNAAVLCSQDMMYQKNTLESIRLKVELPMILEMDSKGAADLVNSFSVGGHTQHIDVKQCKSVICEMNSRLKKMRLIFSQRTLMDLSSNAMQSYFLVKERSAARGVTLTKGGV
jgi:hypothetical protein